MKSVIRLTNAQPAAAELWLEPWGDRVSLVPGAEYEILATGCPTIEWGDESLTIWAEGELEVKKDGSSIWPPAAVASGAALTG